MGDKPLIEWPKPGARVPKWRPEKRKIRPVWNTVPSRLMERFLDPAWFWMLLGTYEDEPIVFDRWQVADLHDYSRIRFREKAPQIGMSWLRACEAVWESMLFEDAMTAFISIDQREASEKVLYARKLYEGLPKWIQRWVPYVRENVDELAWGTIARPSRVVSLPNTSALRGRKMSIVGDEADFYRDGGRDAYRVAVGRIARGGRVTFQSTVFGEGTQIDLMMQGVTEAGDHDAAADPVSRARFPYPVVENPEVMESIEIARQTLDDADFLEEYECVRGAMGSDPFPAALLRSVQHDEDAVEVHHENGIGEVLELPATPCIMGYDVGKGSGRHPSIASVFTGIDVPWRQVALHQPMMKSRPLTLPEQHEWLRYHLRKFGNLKVVPDGQGIGAHIAQALVKEFGEKRVLVMIPGSKPDNMPVQVPEEMVTEVKRQMEDGEFEILHDKEQIKQFRRTKRTPQGKISQGGTQKRSHYDRMWSSAYAAYGIAVTRKKRSPFADHGLVVVQFGGRRGAA